MAEARGHRRLRVWHRACDLAELVYRLTAKFPPQEQYGLTSQMRRAAISVQANIAEGAGRWGPSEFQRFLSMAKGSLAELDAETAVAKRLEYLTEEEAESIVSLVDEVAGMIVRLRQTLVRAAAESVSG